MGVNVNTNLKNALDGKTPGGPLGPKAREWKLGTLIDAIDDRVITLEGESGLLGYADPSASTAVTGATEVITNFDNTYTLPANTLKVGTKVRMRAVGHHTATTGSETLLFTVRAGTTALAVTGNIDPVANDMWEIDFEFDVRAIGSSGQVVGMGVARSGTRGGTTMVQHLLGTGSAAASHTAIDTTAAQVLAIAVTHQSSATDANSVRMDSFTVEVIG